MINFENIILHDTMLDIVKTHNFIIDYRQYDYIDYKCINCGVIFVIDIYKYSNHRYGRFKSSYVSSYISYNYDKLTCNKILIRNILL